MGWRANLGGADTAWVVVVPLRLCRSCQRLETHKHTDKHTHIHTVAILIKPPGSTHTSPKEQTEEQQEKEFMEQQKRQQKTG